MRERRGSIPERVKESRFRIASLEKFPCSYEQIALSTQV